MMALWEDQLEAPESAEVHWATSTILAIFFAASLVSAVFFGLGYSFGRGGISKPVVDASTVTPSAEPLAAHAADRNSHRKGAAVVPNLQTLPANGGKHESTPAAHTNSALKVIHPVTATAHVRAVAPAGAAPHYMVQIGAIGDHKDANRLMAQLRKSGFHAGIYPSTHDKFLHVQIGPFGTEEQANTMRRRVMASGYRAILKHAS
ncbi:MAG: SPOR domain-containing protein [Acidobacteriaceae bacterium]